MSFSRDDLGIQGRKKSKRILGDAAEVGHVPRLHKTARGLRERLSYAGRIPLFLMALGLFLFGAGITGLILWVSGSAARKRPAIVTSSPLPGSLPLIDMQPVPEAPALEKTVASLLAARTPRQLEPLIRGSFQRPAGIAATLAEMESIDGRISSVSYLGAVASHCLQLESVLVEFDSGRNRLALLSPDPEGVWRVDFDAFDRHVSPDWPTLLSGNPNEGTARIYACPDSYYNGGYQDDRKWACYGLASPDHKTLMFGYTLRGSRQHIAMAGALRRKLQPSIGGVQRMTLDLRHTGTGDARQFEITRVLADDWALGNEPLDARAEPEAGAAKE
jgi:hypothetical protein